MSFPSLFDGNVVKFIRSCFIGGTFFNQKCDHQKFCGCFNHRKTFAMIANGLRKIIRKLVVVTREYSTWNRKKAYFCRGN